MTDCFTLSNGLKVYGEYLPGMRSATVGIWTKTGSVAESAAENGMSHFLEHMFFKGTKNRNYRQIAQEIDNIGAQANAFTSKELTCYYIQSIDEKLPVALEILLEEFEAPEADLAFLAECLGRLGDEGALDSLRRAIADDGIQYYEFRELRNAIEAISGQEVPERDFSGDALYDYLASGQGEYGIV